MRTIVKGGLAAVTAISLISVGYGAGRSHEEAPFSKTATAEADTKPSVEAELGNTAICFSLGVLRSSLGPDGQSSMHIFGDAESVMGEVYASANTIARAVSTVEMALDPAGDMTLPKSEPAILAFSAARVSSLAIPSVQAESVAARGLDVNNVSQYFDSSAPKEAKEMLDQARAETDTALAANSCNPDLAAITIPYDFKYDAFTPDQ